MTLTGKKMIPIYVDPVVYHELRLFALQAEKSLAELIRPLTDDCVNSIIKLATEIQEQKKQSHLTPEVTVK